ncbi:hypothetical protein BJ944DRAFT_161804 [Cunninghamella echinulata]|nr:hypothetical protein BJ944DRAFT_161804 [Cunninghamella echinulata]
MTFYTYLNRSLHKSPLQYINQRSLWTRISSTAPTLESCINECSTLIEKPTSTSTIKPNVCFILISKSFDSQQYQQTIPLLKQRLQWNDKDTTTIIGCIVDRVTTTKENNGHGISLLLGYNEVIQPFQVKDSLYRQKSRSVSVGRWGNYDRLKYENKKSKEWQAFDTVSQPPQTYDELPFTITNDNNNKTPSMILMASDNEPDQLLNTLDHHFPVTPKFGIVGASTPFINHGLPYTLFYNDQIMKAGTVGFISYSSDNNNNNNNNLLNDIQIQYPYLESLGSPFTITRARGNVILDLDDKGATRLLLDLINKVNVSKDEEFYLGIFSKNGNDKTVARITSGDPARGNMSVDTTLDLYEGQYVQFMKKKPLQKQSINNLLNDHQGK